ncbi:MAG: response regulator [Planctomycetota bacterium]
MSEKLIFVVEDDSTILKIMVATLNRMDCLVFPFNAGQQALLALDDQRPDAVICDYNLPDMCGVDVLAAVAKRDPTVFRILSTAGADAGCIAEAMDCGSAHVVLEKPFSRKSLARMIRAIELREEGIRIKYEP